MAASDSLLYLADYSSSSSSDDPDSEDEVFEVEPNSPLSAHPRSPPASSDLDENSTADEQQQGQTSQH